MLGKGDETMTKQRGVLLLSRDKQTPFELIDELDVTDETPSTQIVAVVQRTLTSSRAMRRCIAATPTVAPEVRACVGSLIEQTLDSLRARGYYLDRWSGLWVVKPRRSSSSGSGGGAGELLDFGEPRIELMTCAA